MDKTVYDIDGLKITIETEKIDEAKMMEDYQKRLIGYQFKAIRESAGMSRVQFSEWTGIPIRTMEEWEVGRRVMPDYVLRLVAYKVLMEKAAGRI